MLINKYAETMEITSNRDNILEDGTQKTHSFLHPGLFACLCVKSFISTNPDHGDTIKDIFRL